MKKFLSLLFGVLLSISLYSQSGGDCTNAIAFPNSNTCFNNDTLQNQKYFSFVADQTSQNIQSTLVFGSPGHIHTMGLYSGPCSGLVLVEAVSVDSTNDSILTLNVTGLTIGTTYYIYLSNQVAGCAKCIPGENFAYFNLCLSPLIPPFTPCASTDGGITYVCCPTSVVCVLATVCAGDPVDLVANNSGTYSTAGYTFSAPGGSLSGSTVTYSAGGTYTVCVGLGMAVECGTIVVLPPPVITVNSPSICIGGTATLTASGAGAGGSYSWSTGASGSTITVSPATTTSYTVTGTDANGCTGTAIATVTVNPIPVISPESNLTFCSGASVPANGFVSTPSGATFSWTNSNIAIGLAASGTGGLPSFVATNGTGAPITATITVTPIFPGCSGSPITFTITVNPTPVTAVNSTTICAGSSAVLTAVGASTYLWSTGSVANPITVFPVTTTSYTVTGTSFGCTSSAVSVVTVNPTSTVTAEPNLVFCDGAAVAANTFASSPAGATFTWTNSNIAIGLAASGTTSLPAFTATNGTGSPITSTITVTPTLGSCTGTPITFTITVNPVPVATPFSQTICSGFITGINAPAGTTYSWTVVQTGVLGASAGSGTSITQTLTTTTSSSGTAVYTITPMIGTCAGTSITVTVTVNPLPVVTAEPNLTYCTGAPVPANTFASTPVGASFTWTNSNPAIGLGASGTTSLPAFTATNGTGSPITATITVTPTLGGCPGTPITFTITVNPVPVATPFSQVFCSGNSTTINAPSGVTYTWTVVQTNVTGASAGSGTSITQVLTTTTPGVTGTAVYTITPSIGLCTGATITVTLTVNPNPVVIITPAAITIPLGGSTTLTASGASGGYVWSTGAGFNPITVSPTTTTTYTVTGTNQNGCSATATATVTVVNYPCAISAGISPLPPSSPTTSGTIPDGATSSGLFGAGAITMTGDFKIVGTFIINSNVQTIGCNFIMEQVGATVPNIKVTASKLLTLSQNTHIYSCTTMWDGIYVSSGCSIICQNNVIIEDALQAINILPGARLPALPSGCSVTATIFNKNLYGIKLPANPAPTTPIAVTNSIFTCRQLIFTSATPAGMPSVATVKPILATANPSSTLATINLLPPNAGRKSFVGVYATDVNNLTIGDNLPAATAPSINVFDAIMTGINISNPTKPNTTTNIYHNTFQFILGVGVIPCSFGFPCPYSSGFGINALGMNSAASNNITVGGTLAQGNSFRNTFRAVNISYYQTITAQRNNITNTSTGPFPIGVVNYGNGGIFINPAAQNSNILIADQVLIKNCATAIWVSHPAGAVTGLSLLRINNNGTSPASPGITSDATATAYCNNGIYVTDLISSTTPHALWQIRNNFVTETNNCIFLSNVKKPTGSPTVYDMFSNSCRTRYIATGILTGIKTIGAKGITITENHTNYTPGSAAYVYPTGNLTAYGLYLQNSSNMNVSCNLFENAGRSMVFEGGCASPTLSGFGITQNTMRRAQDGFVLKNNGIIGTQGSSSVASNNYWDMSAAGAPNFTFSEIFTDATGGLPSNANVFSRLYMNNITAGASATMPQTSPPFTFPALSKSSLTLADRYILGTGLNVTSAVPAPCLGTPPPAFAASGSMTSTDIAIQANFLKTMEEDSTLLSVYNDETHWQRKKYVFDEVDDNPAYTVNPALSSFYIAHTGSAFDKFTRVDRKIALGQYTTADAINSSITPANIVESNQQTVNAQILLPLLTPTYIYSPSDISILYGIANQCPLQGGNGVYQARILLMNIASDVIEFVDNCDREIPRSMNILPESISNEEVSAYNLYPNPNDGNMTFDYSMPETSSGMLMLYDVTGRLVNSYKLAAGQNNNLKISENELQNGIYFYSVIVDDKVKAQNKIVIVK